MFERRKAPRRRVYLGARVQGGLRDPAMDCVIRNISRHGAKFVLTNTLKLPEQFYLEVNQNRESFRVRVAWRRMDAFGVAFLRDADEIAEESANGEPERLDEASMLTRRIEQVTRRVSTLPETGRGTWWSRGESNP